MEVAVSTPRPRPKGPPVSPPPATAQKPTGQQPTAQAKVAPPEQHHRDIQGGAARAAVLGVSDGLVTNVSLILGVAGANTTPGTVRLTGIAGLLAGAFSMAAGEYVSMKAQSELLQRELEMEAIELKRAPDAERQELVQLYESRGIDADVAGEMAQELMRTPELALETHAREELGLNPEELGNPYQAAGASAASFAIGAIVPLVPWFVTQGAVAVAASLVLGALAAILIGVVLGRFTGRSILKSTVRQLIVTIAAAGVTFAIGKAVGHSVS
jgi:VIT1/CCC1 family predicted Fe2+/Mn2+ transporter